MTVSPLPSPLSERRLVTCREYGQINDVAPHEVLGPEGRLSLAPGVLGHYVKADFKNNQMRLSALGVTGLVPLTDRIALQVTPRFPLRNLTQMVTACGYIPTALNALREYRQTDDWNHWLLDVMADGLLAGLDTIRANGLLRTYVRRTEVSSYPHGRIDMTATMLRLAARGIRHQAQYSWFERTVDNAPNRCLKSAVLTLHTTYVDGERRHGTQTRISRLGDAMRVLADVTTETRPHSLDDAEVRGSRPLPATRAYYRPVLDLAVAILSGRGISLDPSKVGVSLPSLLVKTEDLFEEYVRLSLQRILSSDTRITVLDGNKDPGRLPLYEEVPEIRRDSLPAYISTFGMGPLAHAQPDLVFRATDGSHPLVAEVKYTAVSGDAERSEMEQAMVYAVRYGSPIAMTVHPKRANTTKGLHLSGRIGSLLVMHYRVDLGATDLQAEMLEMAQVITALCVAPAADSQQPNRLPA